MFGRTKAIVRDRRKTRMVFMTRQTLILRKGGRLFTKPSQLVDKDPISATTITPK